MHLKPVIAANWKLNHGPTDAKAFLQRFLAQVPKLNDRTVIFFPSAITLTTVTEGLRDRPEIWVGVQNVHAEAQGAFTGENSVLMARDAGARVVLVGHSERRHVFGESDETTTKKMALIAQARLTAMLCVGETLAEREAGHTADVVERQLAAGLKELDDQQIGAIMLAYEPVWAIGTGRTATPEDAAEIHGVLRRALASRVGDKVATGIPILYGGSVNRGNASQLLAASDVDGLLVGGASLDADGWAGIVRA
ncbi:triosephosphate isomerase [Gemmatimonas aurantiaca T-27]|uniref:Triosephosphate isomerase n=1 Tax=Gemmatimonas aurantiaca (strain DSM 14586 / JCM 11422 / NBRC 100505 / T-27) TaxID=379066 RepID=C1A909_GEMAT|nr:triose-phosphate isomerase [Gemmatimonas aurantiaca]BAH38719.1 triosephosphate isomerase [Gemmatimonas aurantiaca T-27]